jgi:hypothetical protein
MYLFFSYSPTFWPDPYVALDKSSHRYLRTAEYRVSPKEVKEVMNDIVRQKFCLFSPGRKDFLMQLLKCQDDNYLKKFISELFKRIK